MQADPYLKGVVIPVQDRVPDSVSKLRPKVMQVKEALYGLNSLEIKLKVFCSLSLSLSLSLSANLVIYDQGLLNCSFSSFF